MRKVFMGLVASATLFSAIACSNANRTENTTNEIKDSEEMSQASKEISSDSYITEKGELNVTLVGHASLIFEYDGKIIHVDPYSKVADYSILPKADLIILTHEHSDHLDTVAINQIKKSDTEFIVSKVVNEQLGYGEIMNNGDKRAFNGVSIEAVPAYNLVNKNPEGLFYHPKGRGNGYVFAFGDKKVYVAGDTENIPEMKVLKDSIYIAFLPKNLPYTMTDEMFVDAVQNVNPTYLYPYHFSEFEEDKIEEALKDTNVKMLVRPMSNK